MAVKDYMMHHGEVSMAEIVEFLNKMDEYNDEAFGIFNRVFDCSPILKLMYYYDDKSELPDSDNQHQFFQLPTS